MTTSPVILSRNPADAVLNVLSSLLDRALDVLVLCAPLLPKTDGAALPWVDEARWWELSKGALVVVRSVSSL